MIYGYARVSARVTALTKRGAGKVFRETASGAKTDRGQLACRRLGLFDQERLHMDALVVPAVAEVIACAGGPAAAACEADARDSPIPGALFVPACR